MEITYQGGASFQVKGARTVSFNPAGAVGKDEIVLCSSRKAARNRVVDGPGEYEIGGVLIVSFAIGTREAGQLAHAAEVDGLNVLFFDGQPARLDERTASAVGHVDVLLVRADDVRAAQELAQDVAPRVVIPFGEKAAELCAELGVKDPPVAGKFAWNGTSSVPKAALLRGPATKRKAA